LEDLLKAWDILADTKTMSGFPSHLVAWVILLGCAGTGCTDPRDSWPPPPRDQEERNLIEAAREAVRQHDGWDQVLWVVERFDGAWRVQAWKIIYPQAKGRNRCSPAWVRGVHFDTRGTLTDYRNHL